MQVDAGGPQIGLSVVPPLRLRHLVLPLRALEGHAPRPPAPTVPLHTLDLTTRATGPLAVWAPAVQRAAEPCLLIDREGRVCALSRSAARLLSTTVGDAVGCDLVDLLTVVDFTSLALPEPDLATTVPPLRSLSNNVLARGLLRLRGADGTLTTYDVISTPLADGKGALSFLLVV